MSKSRKIPKVKKGMWFVRVRGSYLPASPQAVLLHLVLLAAAITVLVTSYYDDRSLILVGVSMLLQLTGLGALFTFIASKKT